MLKGLEISVVKLSELNNELRVDAEYFSKEYLNENLNLSKIGTEILGNFAYVTDGQHGYYEADENSSIHMLAARNCKNYFANTIDALPLAKWVDDKNKRSSLQVGDIILSTRGSIGSCAIVYEEVLPANINQDVARIKLNNKNVFLPEFLITYLNCKYGQNWMKRNQTGMIQQGLPLDRVRSIPLPQVSQSFQQQIESLVKDAHQNLQNAKEFYTKASDLLLQELNLKNFAPKNTLYTTKKLSDFAKTGRLDAEYYQSKYDDLFNVLETKQCKTLGEIVSIKKSIEPGSEFYKESGIPFIRVSDVSKDGIAETSLYLSKEDFNLLDLMPKKDTILLSKDGSIGIAYKVEKDLQAYTSGALLHLQVKDNEVLPDYLTLVLNSMVVKLQAERDSNGAIIQHWKPSDIQKVVIPLLPPQTQAQIAQLVQNSFSAKAKSKLLLDRAKKLVEDEIEKV